MRDGLTAPQKKHPDYLEWIRQLDCMGCGVRGRSEAHHLKGDLHASGIALKAPDWLSMPFCRLCHTKIHEAREGWREAQREALLRTLMMAFDEGLIEITREV